MPLVKDYSSISVLSCWEEKMFYYPLQIPRDQETYKEWQKQKLYLQINSRANLLVLNHKRNATAEEKEE